VRHLAEVGGKALPLGIVGSVRVGHATPLSGELGSGRVRRTCVRCYIGGHVLTRPPLGILGTPYWVGKVFCRAIFDSVLPTSAFKIVKNALHP
jgi:hypothetical protein